MSRFLISCGGTGGHLSPGIALAEALRARGHETRLLISLKKVDARLSEKYPQLAFERMPGTGFAWHPVKALRFLATQARAYRFCRRLIRTMRADVVVGFGGFTSTPLVLAARASGVPAALHESNRVPGRAIRTLGRLARRVYLPPGIRVSGIRDSVTREAGLPVRREISRRAAEEARRALGLAPERRVVAVLGGSQGASALNDWARSQVGPLAQRGIQLYVVTGLGKDREGVVETAAGSGAPVRSLFVPFTDRMAEVMSAADLVVSRAGAGTLAELIRCETPAILIPYPQAADDHQRANAAYFEQQGGGLVLDQSRLGEMAALVPAVVADDARLRAFRDNLRRMDQRNPLDEMLADLEGMARQSPVNGPSAAGPCVTAT